ncbi:SDR family oxidoreductase [Paracandidimonas soli]|uniref:3-oxoacyl-[acyl-carrier protein] reductase n=1 Tax=Paracandidimonas soli TaxID=1917182 RepID=A0A4V2VRH7_9BURK|nr:SDR family oxidoreductase [Paracandidimonas soli]TCU98499.1 3-oxoacyl-[acyl-carrier protein] reductase [Paracandidimonas soli]
MDLGLSNKTALVFGAGGGLGGAIASALAREGARVVVADINEEAAATTVSTIRQAGGTATALAWDLADINGIPKRLDQVREEVGTVDVLVNNTGGPPPSPVHGQDMTTWRKHFESMVLSVIAITDAVLPAMKTQRWGRIITSTSSGVVAPIPNLGLSNALRISLLGWSKTLAREVGRDGITANIILPGRIATGRITYLDEAKAKREGRPVSDVQEESTASIPLGRYGHPEEYADAVAFLASERAAYITGSTIRVDGGLIASI